MERRDSESFSSVRERDIDLLLLEELTVSAGFREWFLTELTGAQVDVDEFLDAWHSLTDSELGESDVEFGIRWPNGSRLLILVENKIDAPFQEDQLERYRERGEEATDGEWDEFATALFAPESYIQGTERTSAVDGVVSYESAREWFNGQDTPRTQFKSDMITEALEQSRRGYTPDPDEDVTGLHQFYWELAHDQYPELGMNRPDGVPSGNLWVRFDPQTLPTDVKLIHKMGRGDVDLQFSGAGEDPEAFDQRFRPAVEEDMEVVQTGKSLSVRLHVPPLSADTEPATQRAEAEAGLQAAHRLLSWYGASSQEA